MGVFWKSYENLLIRVFLHGEFISALKTEPKSMGFEIYAKNGIKIFINIIFLFFVIFSKSYKQKLIMPIESCFLDGKKPSTAKLVDMNFLANSVKYSPWKKFKQKRRFSANPIKMFLLGYFCM